MWETISGGPYLSGFSESHKKHKEKSPRYVRFETTEGNAYEVRITEIVPVEGHIAGTGKIFDFKAMKRDGLKFSGQVRYGAKIDQVVKPGSKMWLGSAEEERSPKGYIEKLKGSDKK